MRKSFFIILVIILIMAVFLPGCTKAASAINGSGKVIDHDVKITGFNSINVKGDFELEVIQSAEVKVTISTDENLLGRVKVSLERKTLMFSIAAPATFFPTSLKVKVFMPDIVGLNLSTGARGAISGFKLTDNFTLFLGGGAALNGVLDGEIVILNLSDASQVNLKGTATKLELESKGKSKADLGDLVLTMAKVTLKEASEATLNVSGRFDLVLNDASKIYYLGNPLFTNTSISGGSTMIHQ